MDFTAIDFETTGYEDGCRNEPWQLGAVKVRGGEIVSVREWFFRPERPSPGLPAAALAAPSLMEQWEDFAPELLGERLVAHNIATERTLLTRLGPLTKWGPWTDTLKFARARYPQLSGYTLSELCTAFGCVPEYEGRTWHDGLYDALACARLALVFQAC